MAYEAVPKALLYLATLVAIGVAVMRWGIVTAVTRDWAAGERAAIDRLLRRWAMVAALGALLALTTRAVGHTIAAFGVDELSWDTLRLMTIESRWGGGWRAQAGASLALVAATLSLNRLQRTGWAWFAAAAAALAMTVPLHGHAADSMARHVLHWGHLLGSGAWLGGLAVLVALTVGPAKGSRGTALVRRFSPLALSGAATTAATGTLAAVLYVGSIEHLTTPYGQALLVKLIWFSGVVACGRANWKRVQSGSPPRVGLMLAELACGLAAVGTTGVLTELEHP